MRFLVVSTSLNPSSISAQLAEKAYRTISNTEPTEWLDLRDFMLPQCDGSSAYTDPVVEALQSKVDEADGIIFGLPVYNYSISGPTKNFFDLMDKALHRKVVSCVVSAGGTFSYMAPLQFMNSLMLYNRCLIYPQYVYASKRDIDDQGQWTQDVDKRLESLTSHFVPFTHANRELIKSI